ncbi:MAG: hypothetical protein LPJ89_04500, partial [Hymenobacteraceae bacterium]|nr:hypothetical protein [Hymenobacteraceae bacterium]
RIAIFCFVIPFIFLGLLLIDSLTFDLTGAFFFSLFLITLLPLGVIVFVFTCKGLRISFKENNYQKKDIGYANLIMGLIIIGCGVLGLGFAYVMTS